MTDRIELINYKGREIFYSDFRDLSGEEYIQIIDENIKAAKKLQKNDILFLSDIRNSVVSSDVATKLKSIAGDLKSFTDRMALIGITGVKKIFFQVLGKMSPMKMKAFNDLENAKEWLVS